MEGIDKVRATHPEVPVYIYDAGHGFNLDRWADYNAPAGVQALDRSLPRQWGVKRWAPVSPSPVAKGGATFKGSSRPCRPWRSLRP